MRAYWVALGAIVLIGNWGNVFGKSILQSGRSGLLAAPDSLFEKQLRDQKLIPAEPESETEGSEEAEFEKAVWDTANTAETVAQYKKVRAQISKLREPGTEKPSVEVNIEGAPEEFTIYLKAAVQWHSGDKEAACKLWKDLLELPIAQRHYRSVWAAYMLARRHVDGDHSVAHENFELVRRLAAAGFADSQNLVSESWGWEAQVFLNERKYSKAIEFYLRQKGTYLSLVSLRMTAARALDQGEADELEALANNETARRVVTSYLVCGMTGMDNPTDHGIFDPTEFRLRRLEKWMQATAAAGAQDEFVAERLALAAYQLENFEEARRFIDEAGSSITAQWLRARLAFRDGENEEAVDVLRKAAKRLRARDEGDSTDLFSTLTCDGRSARQQVFAELGVFELQEKQFIDALDAFMKADSWSDAAYVAERVLTLEELKGYVDSEDPDHYGTGRLRSLLARRYARLNKMTEARPYFSESCQGRLDEFTSSLEEGQGASGEDRGRSYFAASKIMREHGLELMGTELEPDWAIREGRVEWESAAEQRLKAAEDSLPPSKEELRRIKNTELIFSRRFRYRYVAAEIAWLAAKSMPDNSDETARMLCEAGSWIKNLDGMHADKFYKALVRRCRKTELGAKADAKRWFPVLDETPQIEQKSPE